MFINSYIQTNNASTVGKGLKVINFYVILINIAIRGPTLNVSNTFMCTSYITNKRQYKACQAKPHHVTDKLMKFTKMMENRSYKRNWLPTVFLSLTCKNLTQSLTCFLIGFGRFSFLFFFKKLWTLCDAAQSGGN